ncbi:N-acyl-D-glutamate deacylase [compost metagenome]
MVFDADTVADRATWDAPTLPSIGVEHVLVNGRQVFPATPGMTRPGKILRREVAHNNNPKEINPS